MAQTKGKRGPKKGAKYKPKVVRRIEAAIEALSKIIDGKGAEPPTAAHFKAMADLARALERARNPAAQRSAFDEGPMADVYRRLNEFSDGGLGDGAPSGSGGVAEPPGPVHEPDAGAARTPSEADRQRLAELDKEIAELQRMAGDESPADDAS